MYNVSRKVKCRWSFLELVDTQLICYKCCCNASKLRNPEFVQLHGKKWNWQIQSVKYTKHINSFSFGSRLAFEKKTIPLRRRVGLGDCSTTAVGCFSEAQSTMICGMPIPSSRRFLAALLLGGRGGRSSLAVLPAPPSPSAACWAASFSFAALIAASCSFCCSARDFASAFLSKAPVAQMF